MKRHLPAKGIVMNQLSIVVARSDALTEVDRRQADQHAAAIVTAWIGRIDGALTRVRSVFARSPFVSAPSGSPQEVGHVAC